ncbi:hypothetical protein BH11ARM1_BH11ARM1_01790 [soil metagenome]
MYPNLLQVTKEILETHPDGIGYRDFVIAISSKAPDSSREEISNFLADLPRLHPDIARRPKPGWFSKATGLEAPRKRGRPRIERQEANSWPVRPMPNHVDNLTRLGFKEIGQWIRSGNSIECRDCAGHDLEFSTFAYAVNDSVVFIGYAEASKRTDKIDDLILEALDRGGSVRVFILEDDSAKFGAELAERMQPRWNSKKAN